MITRRKTLEYSASLVGLGLLMACGANAPAPSLIVGYAQALQASGQELVAALAEDKVIVPQAKQDLFNKAINDIEVNAAGISGALGNTDGDLLSKVMVALGVVTDVLSPFLPAAKGAYIVLSAAVAMGRVIAGLIGLKLPSAQTQALVGAGNERVILIPYDASSAYAVLTARKAGGTGNG